MLTKITNKGDEASREKALDTTVSFVVQAPAGSGKTELLMQRFLALLAIVDKPERILALTFTKKAAGEMQNRVLSAMQKAKDGFIPSAPHEAKTIGLAERALERDRLEGWGLLENPARLKVQTIDSFCGSLARQMPLLSGLSRYSITDEPVELYSEAAKRTVSMVEDESMEGNSVRLALRHLDNSIKGLMDRLVMMLGRRDQWLRHIERSAGENELRELLEGSFKRAVEGELESVRDAFPAQVVPALVQCARYAATNIGEGKKCSIRALSSLQALPTDEAADLPLWRGIRELLLTNENEWRKPKGVTKNIGFPSGNGSEGARFKKDFQEMLESLEAYERLKAELSKVEFLPEPGFDTEEWEILKALIRLLPIAERHLKKIFGEEGLVDFQAISLAALKSLGKDDSPTDLMLALDMKLQHILVDEYQDTSHTQLALLEALTRGWTEGDGRTLFVVGDPMQSIYLFREAEVGLFLEAKNKGIGMIPLAPLRLTRNFRSQRNLVDWVNGSFGGAFPVIEDTFTGKVTYSGSEAVKGPIDGAGVSIKLLSQRDDAKEAEEAVSIIKGIPVDESAAVLCRSRTHLDEIIKALKKEGIRFRAQELDPLLDRVVVQDLFALLRALLHPFDRVAWLASLRAPWCGLSLEGMHNLCFGDKTSPVWSLLNDDKRLGRLTLTGVEAKNLKRLRAEFEKALGLRGRAPVTVVLRGLWLGLGGPACVEDDAAMEDAEEFFSLLGSTEKAGEVLVSALKARMKRLYASHGGSPDVRLDLMTIHKAKGLEFDNVIIPGLGRLPRNEEKRILLWMERGEEDLLLAPIEKKGGGAQSRIYDYLFRIAKEKIELEETRLFYVGATRARKSLFLLGHVKLEAGEIVTRQRSFAGKINRALRPEMVAEAGAGPEKEDEIRFKLKRLAPSWELPEPSTPVPVDKELKLSMGGEPEFYWAGEGIRHLGTVVHRYLCGVAREGLDKWDEARVRKERERLRAMLRGLGLNAVKAEEYSREGAGILQKALKDERGRWILKYHADGAVELPLTARIGGEITHVVIDRTFVDEFGVRWVIDYKTGVHAGGSLDEFLKNEKERYRGQLERYAEALRAAGEKREIKKGLYFPAHGAWVEL